MQSWRNIEEFRASNNKILELSQGTFKNLPMLQYLDISSNDITNIERGAIRNLPELQEIVFADNRLSELRERVFEDLPNRKFKKIISFVLITFIFLFNYLKCKQYTFNKII